MAIANLLNVWALVKELNMSKNDNLDLDNDNINEPINPEEALSKLGVGSASAEKSVKHNRKAPRRNGKGVNQKHEQSQNSCQ